MRRRPLVVRILLAAVMLVVLNFTVGFIMSVRASNDRANDQQWAETTKLWTKFYPDAPWKWDLGPDHQTCIRGHRVHAYIDYFLADCDRPTVHIKDRMRRTLTTADADDPTAVNVWFFGGSTMYGWGVRDEDTLPSRFVEFAHSRGIPVKVSNFGLPAYVAWQETQVFEEKLATGDKPDLAIFYDGYNDVMRVWGMNSDKDDFAGTFDDYFDSVLKKVHDPYAPLTDDSAVHYIYKWLSSTPRVPSRPTGDEIEARATRAARVYAEAREHLQRLAHAYDVPVVNVWQPIRALQPTLMELDRWDMPQDARDFPGFADCYARTTDLVAAGSASVQVVRNVTGNARPIWLDAVHVTGDGNGIIGLMLLQRIEPQLRELAGAKRAHLKGSKEAQ